MTMSEQLKEDLRKRAQEFGFSACAVTQPGAIPQAADRLSEFVEAGFHGQMGWMADRMH